MEFRALQLIRFRPKIVSVSRLKFFLITAVLFFCTQNYCLFAQSPACDCTEYIYLNEPIGATQGQVHKFSIDPVDGSMTEITTSAGDPWYPGANASELPSPHGLAIDLNGNVYVGETAGGDVRKLDCDGNIVPAADYEIDRGGFNFSTFGNTIYLNPGGETAILAYDLCTTNLINEACLNGMSASGEIDWGLTITEDGTMYATSGYGNNYNDSDAKVWKIEQSDFGTGVCVDPILVTDPSGADPGLGDAFLPTSELRGITVDPDGNIYVVEKLTNIAGRIHKYDSNGVWLDATPIDAINGDGGYAQAQGIVFSEDSGYLYVSTISRFDDCVSIIDPATMDYIAVGVPSPGTGIAAKGIAIVKECCPTSTPLTIDTTLCQASVGSVLFLQELINCEGSICEGVWEEGLANTGLSYDPCDNSVTIINPNACGSYTIASDGTGNNPQCGVFSIAVNIEVENVTAAVISGTDPVCADNDDPPALTVNSLAIGSGPLTYLWQSSTTDCDNGWMDIVGAPTDGSAYDPPTISGLTYYRLISSVNDPCALGNCADTSNCIVLTPATDCGFFDLALTKVINTSATPGPFLPGSTVQFSITVINQGTIDAFDVDIADYNPTGLGSPTLVSGQTGITENAPGDFTIDFVAAGTSVTIEVEAVIDPSFTGTMLINDAEITGGSDTDGGADAMDIDSNPGDNATPNDVLNDDIIDDVNGGDDQDPAVVPVTPCEEVSGVAFLDANNDGCQSGAEEIGVAGMEASIFECDASGAPLGAALATVPTGADGSYAFGPTETGAGMLCLDPAKTYTVSFGFPADGSLDNLNFSTGDPAGAGACDGTDSADDSAANDGTTGCVDPSADTADEHIDIGLYPCEEVSGVAFLDANNDGCQSGAEEIGVAGMEASIFECDASGAPLGAALATVPTGADGSYAFGPTETGAGMLCLDPSKTYTVSFGFPADDSLDNLNFSTGDPAGAGACDGTDSADDSAVNDGTTGCVDPSADTADEHIDIGLYPCEEVSGVAFLDANNDGCQSGAEEIGVAGMEASIFECDASGAPLGAALATVPTGADGSYAFGPTETGAGMLCLDPAKTYTVSFGFPADGSLDNLNYSTGDPAGAGACDGTDSADDSAANDGTTGCYDPADPSSGDDGDEHIDIGLYPCEEVSGVAFLDANNDGCQSGAEEIGVAGMEASIFECDASGAPLGAALATVPTGADGSYAFGPDEVGAGMLCLDPAKTYTVSFGFPADGSLDNLNYSTGDPAGAGACAGTDSADDSAANDGTTGCVDPSADTDDEHIDIGLYPCEEVSGVAFLDANNDGCQSGAEEIGVAGMEASIFECDASGAPIGAALATVPTGVDGSYAFGPDEVGAGMLCLDPAKTYTVSFGFPADGSLDNLNYSTGDPAGAGACAGTDSSDDSAANDGTAGCVDPSADTDDEHIDIGLYPCEEVSGVAFLDANNDGCQSGAEEIGVAGMEASIFECDASGAPLGAALATVPTGADGSYAFGPDEVGAGMLCLDPAKTYTVSFGFPADGSLDNLNYSTGDPAGAGACAGTDSADDSAANDGTTGCYDPADPASGDDGDEDIDIGLYPCETVAGVVFVDADEDGCQALASDGIAGVTVELYTCNADGSFSLVSMTTTGADGSYAFGPDEGPDNICLDPALAYRTQISAPSGFNFTTGTAAACPGDEDDSPANDGISACYNPSDTDPTDMDTDEHIDFGIYCGVKTDAIITGSGNACYIDGGNAVFRNIITDDSEILPAGYQIVYILVDDTGTIILFNSVSEYFVAQAGIFQAYSVAYNPNDYDVTTASTIADITSNWTCGDISAPAEIKVTACCLATSGWLTNAVVDGCADPANGTTATLSVTQNSERIPAGYVIAYLLRDGATDILLDYSYTPSFDVDQIGSYFISPIVYDPANLDITAIDFGNENIFDFNIMVFNLGVCDHFNLSGIELLVEECCQDNSYIPGVGIGVNGGLYEVSQNITSDGTINSANVEYSAGNSVELMPGFEVEIGLEFHAFIEGCN